MFRMDLRASTLCQLCHHKALYLELIMRMLPQVGASKGLVSGAEGDRTLKLSIANGSLRQDACRKLKMTYVRSQGRRRFPGIYRISRVFRRLRAASLQLQSSME